MPKTGGQTLATRLASAFTPSVCYVMQQELRRGEDEALLQDLARRNDFIEAHVRGDILRDLVGFDILTTVRDPLEQMISNYRHIRREPANLWHRAALKLSPAQFFDGFGDFFADHQTAYILSAFGPLHNDILRIGRARALHARFFEALDRIRWLAPTESIDEFVRLWSLETGMLVPNAGEVVNEATNDGVDVPALRKILRARPHLYAFDALLHEAARERFADYRKQVFEAAAPWSYPTNSRRAFSSQQTGVWLTENWGEPEVSSGGLSWWAGPSARSEVRFRRHAQQTRLSFDVTVVNGVERHDIAIFDKRDFRRLDVEHLRRSEDVTTLAISLAGFGSEGDLVLTVPSCYAPIMTTQQDEDCRRKSFLSTNWRLTTAPPT